ncbi:dTDP-4-dehydrorhamnose 3,5-epimerase [Escherichia albertii]
MNVIKTKIKDLIIIEPKIYNDERGYFYEFYNKNKFTELGISLDFVQDNRSSSSQNVLRGLHFQKTKPQGKLVTVTKGEVFDVAVDLRKDSRTFGQYESVVLTEENKKIFYIPPGFAHGFCVLSNKADFFYKCTDFYYPNDEGGIIWNDSSLSIEWPVNAPVLSKKDMELPTLKNIRQSLLDGF